MEAHGFSKPRGERLSEGWLLFANIGGGAIGGTFAFLLLLAIFG